MTVDRSVPEQCPTSRKHRVYYNDKRTYYKRLKPQSCAPSRALTHVAPRSAAICFTFEANGRFVSSVIELATVQWKVGHVQDASEHPEAMTYPLWPLRARSRATRPCPRA